MLTYIHVYMCIYVRYEFKLLFVVVDDDDNDYIKKITEKLLLLDLSSF